MTGKFRQIAGRFGLLWTGTLAIVAAATVAAPLAAQLVPPPGPPFSGRAFRGPSRPTVPPGEAARIEEEIEGAARVSILNLDRSPLGTLVEARLRDKKMVNWWPRSATGKLLADVQLYPGLDLLAASDSKTDKPTLPDAIILIRTWQQGESRQAEVVVCEPGLGLRLGAQRITLSGEAGKDVDALVGAATSGLKKLGETMRQLWAVPPFRSNDLTQTSGDLRTALALETEQELLSQKGTFTVELEYAHVLAAARRMAGIEQGVSRPAPRLVLGEYRHEPGEPPNVSLAVTVQENDSPGEQQQLSAAAAAEAIKALRGHISKLAKSAKEGAAARDDGNAEKNLISATSRAYQREGNWRAALALAECRLLLDPADRQWRSNAIGYAAKLVREQVDGARRFEPPPQAGAPPGAPPAIVVGTRPTRPLPPQYVRAVVETLDTYRRAMDHFERQLSTVPAPEPRGTYAWLPGPAHDFIYVQLAFSPIVEQSPELTALVRGFRRQRQELVLRYNEIAAANGEAGDMVVFSELSPEERRALVLRMIVDFRHYPRAEMRNQSYIGAAFNYQGGRENAEQFLEQLAALSDPTVQKAVEQQRQMLTRRETATERRPTPAATPARAAPKPPAPDPDAQIVFAPLSLPWKTLLDGPETREVCELFLPLGKAGDLFCYRGQVLLSKKKGDYKLIWEGSPNLMFRHMTSAGYGPSLACYDGKYAWVPVVDPGKPARLLVIDPATEKVSEVTTKEGLPGDASVGSSNPLLGATALAPGKALLAGSFGRAWLGVATFDPEKGAAVKIIHEARDLPVMGERDQHLSATLAFDPTWLFTLTGKSDDGKPMQKVLVGRYAGSTNAVPYPLIVDPETGKVEVVTTPLAASSEIRPMGRGGAVYWAMPWNLNAAGGQEIWRLSLPELKPQSLAKQSLQNRSNYVALAMEEGKVHLLAQQWQTAASWDETMNPLRGSVPGQEYERRQPVRSEIHGWLLLNTQQGRIHAVEFKEQAKASP
jgi:hypothetical protein